MKPVIDTLRSKATLIGDRKRKANEKDEMAMGITAVWGR